MALNTDNKDRSTRGSAFSPLEVPEIRHFTVLSEIGPTLTYSTVHRTRNNKTNSIVIT